MNCSPTQRPAQTRPEREQYRRQLEALAARYGQYCAHAPEVMLSHAPDVLLEQMQETTPDVLWSPVGVRTGVYVVPDAALLVAQHGSAVMVCRAAGRVVG